MNKYLLILTTIIFLINGCSRIDEYHQWNFIGESEGWVKSSKYDWSYKIGNNSIIVNSPSLEMTPNIGPLLFPFFPYDALKNKWDIRICLRFQSGTKRISLNSSNIILFVGDSVITPSNVIKENYGDTALVVTKIDLDSMKYGQYYVTFSVPKELVDNISLKIDRLNIEGNYYSPSAINFNRTSKINYAPLGGH